MGAMWYPHVNEKYIGLKADVGQRNVRDRVSSKWLKIYCSGHIENFKCSEVTDGSMEMLGCCGVVVERINGRQVTFRREIYPKSRYFRVGLGIEGFHL